jgi:FKBP-type peptidyl-prolyl cis-trans isomerase 2
MINIGDTVKVHYTGKYEDGTVFDSTAASGPILFTIGDEMMIEGFENAVRQMQIGEKKTVKLAPAQAYGEYDPALIYTIKKDEFFKDKEIKTGDSIQIPVEDSVFTLTVVSIDGNEVKLDGNPEMAGRTVIFDIELLDIMEGSPEGDVAFDDDSEFSGEY